MDWFKAMPNCIEGFFLFLKWVSQDVQIRDYLFCLPFVGFSSHRQLSLTHLLLGLQKNLILWEYYSKPQSAQLLSYWQ
ncbi:Hypothetical predicted protein [Olea europaea subsp. europaea]|uniref:Uncharacterized protein n=1 Tax=Olea europaea subsp. europaea TaxID=158383 RepID=A0A8S0PC95_OLEEU|nr:Hypothetical predicted protein [Olea europaea subsp. europaea]